MRRFWAETAACVKAQGGNVSALGVQGLNRRSVRLVCGECDRERGEAVRETGGTECTESHGEGSAFVQMKWEDIEAKGAVFLGNPTDSQEEVGGKPNRPLSRFDLRIRVVVIMMSSCF